MYIGSRVQTVKKKININLYENPDIVIREGGISHLPCVMNKFRLFGYFLICESLKENDIPKLRQHYKTLLTPIIIEKPGRFISTSGVRISQLDLIYTIIYTPCKHHRKLSKSYIIADTQPYLNMRGDLKHAEFISSC